MSTCTDGIELHDADLSHQYFLIVFIDIIIESVKPFSFGNTGKEVAT